MASFDGAKQGIAVGLWALVIAILVAVATGSIITAVLAIAASLGGAILGGLAGMRFHRKVDRTALGH